MSRFLCTRGEKCQVHPTAVFRLPKPTVLSTNNYRKTQERQLLHISAGMCANWRLAEVTPPSLSRFMPTLLVTEKKTYADVS